MLEAMCDSSLRDLIQVVYIYGIHIICEVSELSPKCRRVWTVDMDVAARLFIRVCQR